MDTFVFGTGDGLDVITDFVARGGQHDILDLSALTSIVSFEDLMQNHVAQQGDNVLIDGLNGDDILLKNIKLSDLDAGDFRF